MANISPDQLGAAIEEQLSQYHENIVEKLNRASDAAVKALVKKTKATAPVASGSFKKNIAGKVLKKSKRGDKYVWYVKAPDYRITHLLVHGHAKQNGGRVPGNPFLANALAEVLPEFENAAEEAVRND